jgi:hypothetical protein
MILSSSFFIELLELLCGSNLTNYQIVLLHDFVYFFFGLSHVLLNFKWIM